MSGGVDSTATALLLKQSGLPVVGLHMRLHSYSKTTEELTRTVAKEIGVPVFVRDLSQDFNKLVIDPFLREYSRGRTPSPCPICNRWIKATLLFEHARSLGCDTLATGHYARIEEIAGRYALLKAEDRTKDQSYFLFMLTPEILRRTLFPLGTLSKDYVRGFLRSEGITVSESEESQELCFIPNCDYKAFLSYHGIGSQPGPIVDLRGEVLGRHEGIYRYTVGQRRGLGVCAPKPYYVVKIVADTNTIVVGTREETFASTVRISKVNILEPSRLSINATFDIKIRSTTVPVPCTLIRKSEDFLEFKFDQPQPAVAPGQAAVLYYGDRVIGGGWIDAADNEIATT
jgi:tRNA-specific 2-thiouridylase